jgi:trans-2,3-dihydro-3-hydroxyanthranilate isomerase
VLRGTSTRPVVTLALQVGAIPVRFEREPGFGEMRQNDPVLGEILSMDEIVQATGLPRAEISTDVPIQRSSTGLPFVIVPVRSSAALQALSPERGAMRPTLQRTRTQGFYFLCREPAPDSSFVQARMFDADSGEDPATGSAGGACTAWMVTHGILAPERAVVIAQGDAIHRPSRIHVRARREGSQVVDVRVGGHVVEVARGAFELP